MCVTAAQGFTRLQAFSSDCQGLPLCLSPAWPLLTQLLAAFQHALRQPCTCLYNARLEHVGCRKLDNVGPQCRLLVLQNYDLHRWAMTWLAGVAPIAPPRPPPPPLFHQC